MLESVIENIGEILVISNFGSSSKHEVLQGKISQNMLGFTFYEKGETKIISNSDKYIGTKSGMKWSVFFASPEIVSIYREIEKDTTLSQLTMLIPVSYIQQKIPSSTLKSSFLSQFIYPDETYVDRKQVPITKELLDPVMKIMECKLMGDFRKMYIEAQCLEIISLLFFNQLEFETNYTFDKITIDKLFLARDYLIQNFNKPPTIEVLSKKVGLNTFTLKTGFKKVFNLPPHQWITHFRMDYAKTKLISKNYSVTEVSDILGYSNPNSFNTAYRKFFGFTPGKTPKLPNP